MSFPGILQTNSIHPCASWSWYLSLEPHPLFLVSKHHLQRALNALDEVKRVSKWLNFLCPEHHDCFAEEEGRRKLYRHGMSRARILPAQRSTQFSPWSTDSATRESSANTVDFELFLVSLHSKAMCHLLGKTSKRVPFFTAALKLSRCLKDWGSESHFPRYPRAQIRWMSGFLCDYFVYVYM